MSAKKQLPKRAKLVAAGGFYQYVPLKALVAKINVPVMRRISLNEAGIDYSETWHFSLMFGLTRITKSFVEYHQVDMVKVETPKA